jgi:AMP phosphorylase
MKLNLKIKILDIYASYPVVILHPSTAEQIGAQNLDRLKLKTEKISSVFVMDTSNTYVDEQTIGMFKDTAKDFNLKDGDLVLINLLTPPLAIKYVMNKIKNKTLSEEEIREIVKDIDQNSLSEIELSAFVTGVYINGLNLEETKHLCNALVDIGDKIDFNEDVILDKHSIGGINGRVSMILTPIIASLGYKIPKTASRSITSSAGTADSMEVLAPVSFDVSEIKNIINTTNGVVAWEGKFDLCPVDNKLIDIEHALGINPEGIMIASILSKKKSIGSTHLIIDIPVGRDVKVKNKEDGERLAKKFITISNFLGINARAVLTDGDKPCGSYFGPALEAKNVLEILECKYQDNVLEKACLLSGELLELVGHAKHGEGYLLAKEVVTSGKALDKFKEIIKAQGGSILKSEDVPVAKIKQNIISEKAGTINGFDVSKITNIAKLLGCPKDVEAGVVLLYDVGDSIQANDAIFEFHANTDEKIKRAIDYFKDNNPIIFESMIIEEFE